MIDGNVNYYAIDPFNNPFKVKRDPDWPFTNADAMYPDTPSAEKQHAKKKMSETIVTSQKIRADYTAVAMDEAFIDLSDTPNQDSEEYLVDMYESAVVEDLLAELLTDSPTGQVATGYEEKPFPPFPQCNTT